ncbi:hypothetical protein GCM10012275_50410 [Longimycelium tulufanense]|uniref:Uncharacterized protein n=1 Tax=Longimycelium tulufanense TaxID=907463 RepID=A0A8J3CGW3_9PSEU|nr:hypothetical protein [Longimycelium tulufanense]GGM73616.1 hypothetical protein GCM10012275_50410 [Longimycelium tulufanense]
MSSSLPAWLRTTQPGRFAPHGPATVTVVTAARDVDVPTPWSLTGDTVRGHRVILRSDQPGRPTVLAVFERPIGQPVWSQVIPELTADTVETWPARRQPHAQILDHQFCTWLTKQVKVQG